jgi:hypothetical protein
VPFAAGQLAVFQGGPEGCDENGPAAALLVGYVQLHFFDFAFVLSVLWSKKVGLDAPSSRLTGVPF